MNMSKNAAGIVVLILSLFGVEVGEDTIVELISALTTALSIGLMIWNQLDRPDIKGFFWKK
jgi:hypothetical protein